MKLAGWQSWTPCTPYQNLFDYSSRHFYSPFNQNCWEVSAEARSPQKPVAGWCSFYAFGRNIDEKKILANASIMAKKIKPPLDTYIVIDDGWCNWGDWENIYPNRFPKGLKSTASAIKHLGLKPAIWMAPLLTNQTTPHRLPVFPFNYIQDIENPGVYKKIVSSISILVEKYGFEFLKLDFLYAIYHLKRYVNSKTADQILKHFLTNIRKKYPHVHINLCGSPMGPAIGNCNSMRISADNISPYLNNLWPLNSIFHTHRLNQLEINLNSRQNTSKFWLLDPDCYSVRKSNGLTRNQLAKQMSLIKKSNGLYFLGDDLTKITDHNIDTQIRPLFISDTQDRNKFPSPPK